MRHFLLVVKLAVAVLFVCGTAAAQCSSQPAIFYQPEASATVSLQTNQISEGTTQLPGGPVVPFSVPFSQTISITPFQLVSLVFGNLQNAEQYFTSCAGVFPPTQGSPSTSATFEPFDEDITVIFSGGSMTLTVKGTNNEPVNDGNPCTVAAPCTYDNISFTEVFQYNIQTGAYTFTLSQSSRSLLWVDPVTGNVVTDMTYPQGNNTAPGTLSPQVFSCSSLLANSIAQDLPLPQTLRLRFTPQPSGSLTVLQAANLCGYTNFNWQQTIEFTPDQDTVRAVISSPGCPGPFSADPAGHSGFHCFTPPPFLDPPPGGYTYDIGGTTDAFPLYYDAAQLADPEFQGSGVLTFIDTPSDPCLLGDPSGQPSVAYLSSKTVQTACNWSGRSTALLGSETAFTTYLVGVCGPGADYYHQCESAFVAGTTDDCKIIHTCVVLGVGALWTSNYNGTSGGVGTTNNTQPPDPGSGTGGVTVVNVQETPTAGRSSATPQALASGTACNGIFTGTFSGNINVSWGQNCTFENGTITGNVQNLGGNITLVGVRIVGSVRIDRADGFSIGPNTTINGDLEVRDLPSGMTTDQICGSTISGDLRLIYNDASLRIGSETASVCQTNVIGGDLKVSGNGNYIEIYGNGISENVEIFGNRGEILFLNNVLTKDDLRCEDNRSITVTGDTANGEPVHCTDGTRRFGWLGQH